MATQTFTQLIDDLDGTVIDEGETIRFALDGTAYEIDLTTENAAALRAAIAPFREAARRDGAYRQNSAPKSVKRDRSGESAGLAERRAAREWAVANGYTVNDRGRLTSTILDAYRAAQVA